MLYRQLRETNIKIPPIIFGTSCLGNLYQALPAATKLEIVRQIFTYVDGQVVLDCAGKYGAGLALEVIGNSLRELNIPAGRVFISNKLGWYRVPLMTAEPTFEPGAWVELKNDAVQKISYDGILACWEQGNALLGAGYRSQIVSVHDPDEYLAAAKSPAEREQAFIDILEAYQALFELKQQGVTAAVGVGAKNWRVIRDIVREVELDWVMLAVSYTILRHPPEVLAFVDELTARTIGIINSAVFHAGFLTGGKYFDYRLVDLGNKAEKPLFEWRENFFRICRRYDVSPAVACVQFGMSHPGVVSIALNTSNPKRIPENIRSVTTEIPHAFWVAMKEAKLIDRNYPYLG